jgi:hypothetical protein
MSYLVEYSASPAGPWTLLARVPLATETQNLALKLGSTNLFCRAREFIAFPSVMELSRPPARPLSLLFYGRPGAAYELLSTTNIAGASWQSWSNFTMPAAFQRLDLNTETNQARFYRAREPQQ